MTKAFRFMIFLLYKNRKPQETPLGVIVRFAARRAIA
jgi:hypothetical protein